ncbi:MAG: hypothetical protein GC160_14625 [Acidobacteria bacterium]|nr:hypothetical protein [Acidobacteriota bacterium]
MCIGFRGTLTLGLLALSILCGSLSAQSTTQTIQGLVTDSTGAVIPGASVTMTNIETGVKQRTDTNATGNYAFNLVPVGNYEVRCESAGFKAEVATGLRVDTGGQVRQNFTLEIGEVSETVEVSAAAVTLQTENAITGSVVENKRIIELPLNGRNMQNLAVLTPGVQFGNRTGRADGSGGFPIPGQAYSVSANGQREIHQVVSLDGVDAKDPRIHIANFVPSIEAIEEFKIQTNSYSAEFGFGGGAVTNITMKSGTNQIHGTLFEFLRNDKLDAETYFLNFELAQGVDRAPKDSLRRNQFGFVVSGPLIKNKTFWAVNYEGRRQRESAVQTAAYPLQAFRNGDFSELLTGTVNPATGNLYRAPILVFDAYTGDPYPNNVLPASQINQNVVNNIQNQYIPEAQFRQTDPLDFTARGAINQPINTNLWFGRVDHIFGPNNRVFARIAADRSSYDQISINPNFPRFVSAESTNLATQWVKTITPTTINELRFGFNFSPNDTTHPRTNDESFNMDALGVGKIRVFGDGNRPLTPREQGVMDFTGIGGTSIREATGGNGFDRLDTYQIGDHVSLIRGKHNIKTGFEWYHIRIERGAANLARGRYAFSGNQAGYSYAAFLLGLPNQTQSAEGLPLTFPRVHRFGGYINDDFKATSRLTINMGLRYDYAGNPIDRKGLQRTLDFVGDTSIVDGRGVGYTTADGRQIPTIFPEYVDERGAVKTFRQQSARFFMPRVGLAYRLNEKTVLRSGAGWFDNLDHQNTWTILNLMPPKSGSLLFNSITDVAQRIPVVGADGQTYNVQTRTFRPGSPVLTLNDPFLQEQGGTAVSRPVNLLYVPPDRKDGAVWKWSFDIQRQLPYKLVATIGYVGSKGTNAGNSISNFNNALPSSDTNFAARKPFQEFYDPATPELGVQALGNIRYLDSFGETFHHGLQVKLDRRFSNGFAGGVSYTFSKSHGDGENGGQEGASYSNPFDRVGSRGLYRFDQKHNFVANFVWEMPGKGLPGALKYVLGGWQSNGILSLRTGFPFNIGLGGDPLNLGMGGQQRPDRIADGRLEDPTRKLAYDPLAFQRVTCQIPDRQDLCRYGNAGYNIMRQLPGHTFDFSLYKNIPINERMRVQFRTELFNATNTPYFGNPNGLSYSSIDTIVPDGARQGEIRSLQTDMRTIQFGLKFFF